MRAWHLCLAVIGTLVATSAHAEPPAVGERALRASLKGEAGAERAVTRVGAGPLGLQVVTVAIPDAYPGTGVRTLVVDAKGRAYGKHAAHDLADLARSAGWLDAPPSADALVKVLSLTDFEGMLAVLPGSPTVQKTAEGLELRFVRQEPFDPDARTPVTARIPRKGALAVEAERVAETPPTGGVTDDLRKALDAGAAIEILRAMQAAAGDAAALPLLARATTHDNEAIAVEALSRIPPTDAGVAALRAAWTGLDAPHRDRLVGFARELHGAAFAGKL